MSVPRSYVRWNSRLYTTTLAGQWVHALVTSVPELSSSSSGPAFPGFSAGSVTVTSGSGVTVSRHGNRLTRRSPSGGDVSVEWCLDGQDQVTSVSTFANGSSHTRHWFSVFPPARMLCANSILCRFRIARNHPPNADHQAHLLPTQIPAIVQKTEGGATSARNADVDIITGDETRK